MRLGIVGVVLIIAAYVASIVLYVSGGMGHARHITKGQSGANGTTVTAYIEEMDQNNSVLIAYLTVSPGPALLDPLTHKLKEDLSVAVTSAVTPSRHTWSKGTLPEVSPLSLTLTGDLADWPFDRYRTGPITVELDSGAAQVPEKAAVTFVDRLPGWQIGATDSKADALAPYQVNLKRTANTVLFGVVILGVLIALAGLAVFVALQTVLNRRKFQPPMTTWYAAMLFAVMPLRTALPDSPPFGSWIDVTVVLWVIVVLVVSMMLYIYCWWRHLRPEVDEPADRAPVTSGG
jgi:Domain of unknown function (DUF4436)